MKFLFTFAGLISMRQTIVKAIKRYKDETYISTVSQEKKE